MSSPEPKNDILWQSIARAFYSGFAAYAIVVAIAIARDLTRRNNAEKSSRSTSVFLRWSSRFSSQYRDSNIFFYVEFLRLAANLIVCLLYIIGTYKQATPLYIILFYRIFAFVVLLDIIWLILVAESAISAVFNFVILVDAFSFSSLVITDGPNDYLNFSFLRAIIAFLSYSRLERRMFVHIFSQNRLIVKLCFKCVTLFYTLAAAIQMLEIPGDLLTVSFRERWEEFGDWNFLNSAYFIIVTLSTVGYGDFSPTTVQGRLYALFIIIMGIIVFSSVITELVEQANRDKGAGVFIKNTRTRHVIVSGNPTLSDLVHFVSEFFSDSRQSNVNAKVVVLVEEAPWSDGEWFQYIARNQFLQARLQYFVGSPRNLSDLHRVRINTADAVFILTSPSNGEDPSVQDTQTIMIILAIRNVRNDIAIYAQTLLEDSNLQTQVALSTPSSFAKVSDDSRRSVKEKRKTSHYPGLFYSVLETEFQHLPRAHQRVGRRYLEEVFQYYRQRDGHIDIHSLEDAQLDALQVSQHVCLQEIHMALISGNIRANGVGTLLSNMYLDVQAAKLNKEDPGWLHEYHMGAACSLVYSIVPEELDGVCVKEIANDMFHVGLVLIATTDASSVRPRPVLNTGEMLRHGDLAMLLSYHDASIVGASFFLVALRYARGELRHGKNGPSPGDGSFVETSTLAPDSITPASPTRSRSNHIDMRRKPSASLSNIKLSVSADDLEALAEADERDGGRFLATPAQESEKSSDGYIPDRLRNHVIIAMEGTAPLQNLPLLLKNLWHKDDRKCLRTTKRARIVVIHPSVSDELRRRFSRFERTSLFFVEGSPASRSTWRKAKLSTASAVATVADYTQPWYISDARTIFTLLTLDVSTGNDQDLFICSELIDEKSLEYLREPIHARRRGASLGESTEHLENVQRLASQHQPQQSSTSQPGPSDHHSIPEAERSSSTKRGNRPRTLKFLEIMPEGSREEDEPSAHADVRYARIDSTKEGTGTVLVGGLGLSRSASKSKTSRRPLAKLSSTKGPMSVLSAEAKSLTLNLGADAAGAGGLESGTDPNDRPGAARARRSTLFSRSRYASGELLVESSAITLMAREYIEPGFVSFFTNLLGTDPNFPGMKIRLVRIPQSFFDPARGYTCKQGRPLIRYNDVFQLLVSLGVTPIGIYRSGSAPVLIPFRKRWRRGQAVQKELDPLAQENYARYSEGPETEADGFSVGGFFKRFTQRVREINPATQRENRGKEEIEGKMGHLFSMDGSSEDLDEDEEEDDEVRQEQAVATRANVKEPSKTASNRTAASSSPAPPPQTPRRAAPVDSDGNDDNVQKVDSIRWSRMFKIGSRIEGDAGDATRTGLPGWRHKEEDGTFMEGPAARFVINDDPKLEVPGPSKYLERPLPENLLPYVYTLPDPNTWCAQNDGIFILTDPSFDLPSKWTETANEASPVTRDSTMNL